MDKMSPDVPLSYSTMLAPVLVTAGSGQVAARCVGGFLETVLLDERRVELQSRFLRGILASKEGDKGLALVTLELDHLFAIVFYDVAVASCFTTESVRGSRRRHESHGTVRPRGGTHRNPS